MTFNTSNSKGQEVLYERANSDEIDLYIYFNPNIRAVNGDRGVQPEDVVREVMAYVEKMVTDKRDAPQTAGALVEAKDYLGAALFKLEEASKHETDDLMDKRYGRTR